MLGVQDKNQQLTFGIGSVAQGVDLAIGPHIEVDASDALVLQSCHALKNVIIVAVVGISTDPRAIDVDALW